MTGPICGLPTRWAQRQATLPVESRPRLFSPIANIVGGPASEKCGPRLYGCSLGGSSQELLLLLQHTAHIEIHDNWCSNGEGRVIQHNFRYPQQHAPLTSIHPACSIHLKKRNPSADLQNISDTVNGYVLWRKRGSGLGNLYILQGNKTAIVQMI